MQINIKWLHIESSDNIQNYVNDKIKRIEKLIDIENTKIDIDLEKISNHHKKGDIYKTIIHVRENGILYITDEVGKSLESTIDISIQEMFDAINNAKNRKRGVLKRGEMFLKKVFKKKFK